MFGTVLLTLTLTTAGARAQPLPDPRPPPNIALLNGNWFNGKSFDARSVYSVDGRPTFRAPARGDRTFDLTGMWIVPPFGESHNHDINGIEERDRQAFHRFLTDGVFYVKIPGNLPAVVAKARAEGLRVPVHVSDASDFRHAVAAGVNEITYIPLTPITVEDARLTATRDIVVDTTYAAILSLPSMILPNDRRPQALGVLDNLTLLKMWAETTPRRASWHWRATPSKI